MSQRGQKGSDSAADVAHLAQLLAVAWRQPTPRMVEAIADGAWVDEFRSNVLVRPLLKDAEDALHVLRKAFEDTDRANAYVQLSAEYAALFQGPGSYLVGFHECQWVDSEQANLFIAPSTLEVERIYHEAGLTLGNQEPPDGISVELEFIRHLAQAEQRDGCGAQHRRRFVDQHLGRWMVPFGEAVERATEHGAYSAWARLTAQVGRRRLLES